MSRSKFKTFFEIRGEQKLVGIVLYNVFETRKLARQWLNAKPAHKKDCKIVKVRVKPNFRKSENDA